MRLKVFFAIIGTLLMAGINIALAQECPTNIGFELGDFSGWNCYSGKIGADGTLQLTETGPVAGRHTVFVNTSPQARDMYGDFPVNCPNGSGYSIMLGNNGNGAQAERVSYTFKVPEGLDTYSILYYYAVVFQNPAHQEWQQPRFTAKVYDVATNNTVNCASYDFIASAGIPGFKTSPLGTPSVPVFYKEWSPVTINLKGQAGKTLRLEFTTNDCTQNGHFGYAYVDVNENCKSPITGNNFCAGAAQFTLTAPGGFERYIWHPAGDFSKVLGTSPTLTISPPPAEGESFEVEVIPYYSLGCGDTLTTTVHHVSITFNLEVKTQVSACTGKGADITTPDVTAGSSPGLTFEYYLDSQGQTFLSDPKAITANGIYYIRGTNKFGCTDIKPIQVVIYPLPTLTVKDPPPICTPETRDLTTSSVITNLNVDLKYEFFSDALLTKPLVDPKHVDKSGTYYIKATNAYGCADIKTVNVVVGAIPQVQIKPLIACPPINLKTQSVTTGSTYVADFSFWADADGKIPLTNFEAITQSGTYYIKGTSQYSCNSSVVPFEVTVSEQPQFSVKDPKAVVYPETIDLTKTHTSITTDIKYTYWTDAAATKPVSNYTQVDKTGIYYIKATNDYDCTLVQQVRVSINEPPEADLLADNTFSPNGDGINDLFKPATVGAVQVNYLKIYNRWGQLVFETKNMGSYWDGTMNGKLQTTGAYYWVFNCTDIYRKKSVTKSGSITLVR